MAKATTPAKLDNVSVKLDGSVLVLGIDMSKNLGASKSGKSNLVATTHGIIDVGNGVQLSLTAFRKVAVAA
jgi:hypothetical protein